MRAGNFIGWVRVLPCGGLWCWRCETGVDNENGDLGEVDTLTPWCKGAECFRMMDSKDGWSANVVKTSYHHVNESHDAQNKWVLMSALQSTHGIQCGGIYRINDVDVKGSGPVR